MNRYAARRCPHGTEWHLPCNGCHAIEMRAKIQADNKDRAHKLLTRVFKGEVATIEQIDAALLATGDLEHVAFSVECAE